MLRFFDCDVILGKGQFDATWSWICKKYYLKCLSKPKRTSKLRNQHAMPDTSEPNTLGQQILGSEA